MISILAVPVVALVTGVWQRNLWLGFGGGITIALLWWIYWQVMRLAYARLPFIPTLLLPCAVLADIGLLHYSMWKYEFSEVLWKGRNVCVPVMHVYAHLPKA
jgi:hypothetical protein